VVLAIAWHLVVRHQGICYSCRDERLFKTSGSGSINVLIVSHGSDLIGSSLIMSECSEHFGVSMGTLNVFSFKISDTWHGWG